MQIAMAPADPARLRVDPLMLHPAEDMRAWKVGTRVGDVRNNDGCPRSHSRETPMWYSGASFQENEEVM